MNYNKIAIIGLGYVGLPLLSHIIKSSKSEYVVGFDIDELKVENLVSGKSYINDLCDSDIEFLLQSNRVEFTANEARMADCEVFLVCVPTPLDTERKPNLEYLKAAVRTIKNVARSGSLVINESTSYPGTLREIFVDEMTKVESSSKFYFATAPERINPGGEMPIEEIPRVIGGIDSDSTELATKFYKRYFKSTFPVQTPEIAEMSKLLENTFRQVNISLINEINILCRNVNIDTRQVIAAANTKPYGFMKFTPSAGIGGHCIPVDPEYLQDFAIRNGLNLTLVEASTQINNQMGKVLFQIVTERGSRKEYKRGLIVGVAYKPDIGDVRDTPAEGIIKEFRRNGMSIEWHDPLVDYWNGETSASLSENKWDFALIVTAHKFLEIDTIKASCKVVFDTTGTFVDDSAVKQI